MTAANNSINIFKTKTKGLEVIPTNQLISYEKHMGKITVTYKITFYLSQVEEE